MPRKIIDLLEYDKDTGIPFITDVEGYTYVLERSMPTNRANRVYLQAYSTDEWIDDTDFYSIPCSISGEPTLSYTVPSDKTYYAAFIMIAQQHSSKQDLGVSLVGIYVEGVRFLMIPFRSEMSYVLFEPLRLEAGVHVELKFNPFDKKAILGVLAGGFLTESD